MVKVFFCRTEKKREDLIQLYDISPVSHVKLLNGQVKRSCTGGQVTDSYYCFSYKLKGTDKYNTFLCGKYAAESFLDLLKHPKIPMFNPLSSATFTSGQISFGTGIGSKSSQHNQWHPAAEQLHTAINLLIVCWDTVPGKALLEIKEKVERYKYKEPFPSQIKGINTIISRDSKKRTLQQMIAELRGNGNNILNFRFNHLNDILANENETSYYE